jgi:carbamoyltransferase
MRAALLGPPPSSGEVADELRAAGRPFEQLHDPGERDRRVAALLADGAIVAVCRGRSEFGPRALGNRSILADARSADARTTLNSAVKFRESFRPFAPIVLDEEAAAWFDLDRPSPYMSFVVDVVGATPVTMPTTGSPATVPDLQAALADVRSPIPAVTHLDGTARVQTVDPGRNPDLHSLLSAFRDLTGCPVLVNTSFNVRGEPIVQTSEDAYRCFVHTGIDWLLLEDCLLERSAQPPWDGPAPTVLPD